MIMYVNFLEGGEKKNNVMIGFSNTYHFQATWIR